MGDLDLQQANANARKSYNHSIDYAVLGIVCSLIIVIFTLAAEPSLKALKSPRAEDSYYNQLVRAFRAGRLDVKEAPPGLAKLANPYDPDVDGPYLTNISSMSYYKGKIYLYFGVTPVLILLWPYATLTGHYLSDVDTLLIFLSLGFLVAAGLISAVWRRYFPEVGVWAPAVGILSLGLALGTLEAEWWWCDVFQVAQCCAFAFTMLALAAIWRALHDSKRQILWLLLGSLAYGLAIGSRPSALFGAIILLMPVAQAWRAATEPGLRWRAGLLLAAAIGPLMLIGFGLMLYNFLRFDNPFEFGWRYMLGSYDWQRIGPQFDLHFFMYNFRYYFFEPMRWNGHFPFLETFMPPSAPSGHIRGEKYCGGIILINYPLIWLALAAPLAWKRRTLKEGFFLRWFVAVAFLLFMICALTFCFFCCCESRYELDFLPAGILVSVIGILSLERALAGVAVWRWIGRAGWCLLLAYSVVVSVLAGVEGHATTIYFTGNFLVNQRRPGEAIKEFQKALKLHSASAEAYNGLGNALLQMGQPGSAVAQYEKAIEFKPDLIDAHYNLGYCLLGIGRIQDAIAQNQIVLNLDPKFAKAHDDLGSCYLQEGRISDAIAEFAKAVELAPDFSAGHNDFGYGLLQAGRVPEAVVQFQKAVDLDPKSANFRCGLGNALLKAGKGTEAVTEYQKAVELDPALAGAHYELGLGLLRIGHVNEAIVQYQKAVEIKPASATYRLGLAKALAEEGLTNQAAVQYQKAVELNPSLAK